MRIKTIAALIFAVVTLASYPIAGQTQTQAQTDTQLPQTTINSRIVSVGDFIYLTLDGGDRVRTTPVTVSISDDDRSFAVTMTVFCVGPRISWVCKRAKAGQTIKATGEIIPSLLFVNSLAGPVEDFRFDPLGIVLSRVEISQAQ